jgi:hypothetical protein
MLRAPSRSAAAETPGVADEFGGGDFLDGAGRGEVLPEGVAEVVVGVFFVGVNAVVEGEEAEFGSVGGGFFFAFGGFRSGGGFCVGAVGVDLRFSCHCGDSFRFEFGWCVRSGVRVGKAGARAGDSG